MFLKKAGYISTALLDLWGFTVILLNQDKPKGDREAVLTSQG